MFLFNVMCTTILDLVSMTCWKMRSGQFVRSQSGAFDNCNGNSDFLRNKFVACSSVSKNIPVFSCYINLKVTT